MGLLKDIIDPELTERIGNDGFIGLDIGSTTGKAVLISGGEYFTEITPTGVYAQPTADKLMEKLFKKSGRRLSDIRAVTGTGYGRVSLDFGRTPSRIITEISCHAIGCHYLNRNTQTIVDIGGQDSKAIKVDARNGKVIDFVMNDKCAAGTGRFLEKAAYLMDISMQDLGKEALKAEKPADISSQCVVFAESELISLRAKGESRANIAAGIHIATARRIKNQINRLGLSPELVFSGGVSNNHGMRAAIEDVLGIKTTALRLDAIFAGALGAAILAQGNEAALANASAG
ncbi:MAG: acyl-CoA dehydratase activase [Clostridiales Family XIII bacterium]|jgi:predicted CoA-substrate-specific enzyme activase|nr:acyl-CoA dehydratase activase [Clostridiales Family XIII bacterium]